jgi:REP element-mobilizing transposase RayT
MGVNPWNDARKCRSTPAGSHDPRTLVRPRQGRFPLPSATVGCTHGYSRCFPSGSAPRADTRASSRNIAQQLPLTLACRARRIASMSTYTQIYYHIVFSTKDRVPALVAEKRESLFRYIWGILKNKGCHLYRINGAEDHLHILTSLHPTVSLADLVKEIKTSTGKWIKENDLFPAFTHWQDGYGAFTIAHSEKDAVIEYIKGQQEHHKKVSFRDELREFLIKAGVQFDERYLG